MARDGRFRVRLKPRDIKIPRDQQKCLDRKEAWIRSKPNVPSHVLEQVTAVHRRKTASEKAPSLPISTTKQHGAGKRPVTADGTEARVSSKVNVPTAVLEQAIADHHRKTAAKKAPPQPEYRVSQHETSGRPATPDEAEAGDHESETSESEGTAISWESSPIRQPKQSFPELQPERVDGSTAGDDMLSAPQNNPKTSKSEGVAISRESSPARPPKQPHAELRPERAVNSTAEENILPVPPNSSPILESPSTDPSAFRKREVVVFPSSTAGSDADLEIETPLAITDVPEPLEKNTLRLQSGPTPPSAQIQVVPSTFSEASPVKHIQPKKRRLMKPPNFASAVVSRQGTSTSKASLAGLGSTTGMATTTMPSPVTSAMGTGIQNTIGPSLPPDIATTSVDVQTAEPGTGGDSQQPCLGTDTQGNSSNSDGIPPNGPPSQVPFTAWKLTYPDYRGSIKDYLRAIIYIRDVQGKNMLAAFLYDDFIRVWLDYLDYIKENDVHGTPLLNGMAYYNKHVFRQLYKEGLVTPDNLQEILDKHPAQVAHITGKLQQDLESEVPKEKAAEEIGSPTEQLGTLSAKSTASNPSPEATRLSFGELSADLIEIVDSPGRKQLRKSTADALNRQRDPTQSFSGGSSRGMESATGRKFKGQPVTSTASSPMGFKSQVSPNPRILGSRDFEKSSPELPRRTSGLTAEIPERSSPNHNVSARSQTSSTLERIHLEDRIESTPMGMAPPSLTQPISRPRVLRRERASFQGRLQSTPVNSEALSSSQLASAESIPETNLKRKVPPTESTATPTEMTPRPVKKPKMHNKQPVSSFLQFVQFHKKHHGDWKKHR